MKRLITIIIAVGFVLSLVAVGSIRAAEKTGAETKVKAEAKTEVKAPEVQAASEEEDGEEISVAKGWAGAKYEYLSIKMSNPGKKKNLAKLNELGAQGWKLVATYQEDGYTKQLIFIREAS